MIAPQTKLQKMADNCCLFMCYLYCVGLEPDTLQGYMDYIQKAYEKGFIDDECTVNEPEMLLKALTGRNYRVSKVDCDSIKDITGPFPVKFTNNGYSHFVVVEKGHIVFNSLAHSVCVEKGKPVSYRKMELVK